MLAVLSMWQSAPDPLESVRAANEQVAELLQQPQSPERDAAISEVIVSATSFATLAESAVGSYWPAVPAEQRAEYITVFSELLSISSVQKMGHYSADRIEFLEQEAAGDEVVLRTHAYFEGNMARLDYTLALIEGEWKVVNYALNDVDTVENYRKQFFRVIGSEGFEGLLERLKARLAELRELPGGNEERR
jgi:phospholipid transport system substrate-binding protein